MTNRPSIIRTTILTNNNFQLEVALLAQDTIQCLRYGILLVICDDLSLPFGKLRMKPGGSDAGHNGLKNIASVLCSQQYARLRFGIGNDFPKGFQADYVLGQFTDEDLKTMDERVGIACDAVKSFCLAGINITMNQFNRK